MPVKTFYYGGHQNIATVTAATLYFGTQEFRKLTATTVYGAHDQYSTHEHEFLDTKHV